MSWEDLELYDHWDQAVNKKPYNDFVIVVTASSRTPVSGTGKTTLLTKFGKWTDRTDSGFDGEKKATLDAGELAYELAPELESRSALVGDEMQGAAGTVGMDKRRGMKGEVIDSINAILNNRDKNYTIILGAQRMNMLDKRLPPIVDAWILIRKAPGQDGGPLATYHKVYTQDYSFGSEQIRTPAIEDFTWNRIPHDDPDYSALEELKQEAKTKEQDDTPEPKEVKKKMKLKVARTMRSNGHTVQEIAGAVDMSKGWVSEHTEPQTKEKDKRATA